MVTFTEKLGNVDEYFKQLQICRQLSWPEPHPVFKNWKPVANIDILLEARRFAKANAPVIVRQIYYHLVTVQLLASGKYDLVKRLMVQARNCGLINMDWIIDKTRQRRRPPVWDNMPEILNAAVNQFRRDWHIDQGTYVEVWLEKHSLEEIFYNVTRGYGVYLVPGGGSQSTPIIWESAQNFKTAIARGQKLKILYFGDLNATGKNMMPDILRRLKLYGVANVDLDEVALNEADVLQYNLPRNPEKTKDSRAKWFAEKYPNVKYSVELDALSPEILRSKIRTAIESNIDMEKLRARQAHDDLIRSITHDRLRNLVV